MSIRTDSAIARYPFEPDNTVGNTLIRVTRNDSVGNYSKSDFLIPHRKDYYFMAFIRDGSSRHWIDMKPYTLKPDTFYFTVPHQVHLKEEAAPIRGTTLSFSKEFLAIEENGSLKDLPIISNPHNGHELALNKQDVLFIEDLLNKLHTEYHTQHDWQNNMLFAYVKVLLIYLSRLYTEQFSNTAQSPDRELLRKYQLKLEESYKQRHEVADYAQMLHISAGHLSDVVKEQSGKTAIAHIHERLILEAKRMLVHTDSSIKELAFELGFEDASYFNRFFKRLTQQTPAAYRQGIREMYH